MCKVKPHWHHYQQSFTATRQVELGGQTHIVKLTHCHDYPCSSDGAFLATLVHVLRREDEEDKQTSSLPLILCIDTVHTLSFSQHLYICSQKIKTYLSSSCEKHKINHPFLND